MSARAKAFQNLYRRGKVTKEGIAKALSEGIITAAEYTEITGDTLASATETQETDAEAETEDTGDAAEAEETAETEE